ncbi:MAG: hypothetical protein ACRC48_20265 [Aeromonas veronii]
MNTAVNINLSDILSTIRFNQGHMPTHELAMMLGKRHSNLVRTLKSQGVCLLNLSTRKIDSPMPNGGTKVTDTYLLNERQAVALTFIYDMKLGMMVWDGFKAALEVVDAVNAGEDPAVIAQKAEEATLELLFKSVVSAVCGKVCINTMTKPKREAIMKCLRMVTVQMGGVLNAKADIVETQRLFAVQAKLADIPLYAHYAEKALAVIDKAVLEDKRKVENWKEETVGRFSSW